MLDYVKYVNNSTNEEINSFQASNLLASGRKQEVCIDRFRYYDNIFNIWTTGFHLFKNIIGAVALIYMSLAQSYHHVTFAIENIQIMALIPFKFLLDILFYNGKIDFCENTAKMIRECDYSYLISMTVPCFIAALIIIIKGWKMKNQIFKKTIKEPEVYSLVEMLHQNTPDKNDLLLKKSSNCYLPKERFTTQSYKSDCLKKDNCTFKYQLGTASNFQEKVIHDDSDT
ncbi:DgyrCDS14791 [Dimorphilus gyrociliatus]|uniref:DgyrCDS14791 n=1 Tax=Dimorphilus gyrociliatus TaxID=2664684 RepID=A0A7I8WEV2_9ANNE|nr:DgyrCDS14791 [Dimorphilus gyrociliatus]